MRRALLVVAVALMLVFAGCAGGDGNGNGTDIPGDDTTSPAEDTADEDETDDGQDTDPSEGDDPSDEDNTGDDPSSETDRDEDDSDETDEDESGDTGEGGSDETDEDDSDEEEDGDSDQDDNGEDTTDEAIDDPTVIRDSIVVAELNVAEVGPDEEHIVFENTGDDPLDLSGWTVRDREDDGRVAGGLSPFSFPAEFTLDPGERVTIWTGDGTATETDLYWGYGVNMWNADGDVVILQSPAGENVLEHAYGDMNAGEPGGEEGDQDGDDQDQDEDEEDADDADEVEGDLKVHHIDVGQADSTLIETPDGETILIDTGDWRDNGEAVISYLEAHDINRIDHLVATHSHADHIGGHAAVIEHFETERDGVGAAYDSGVSTGSATYENYLDAIEEHDVGLFIVEEGDELPIEDSDVEALVLNPPGGDSGSDLNHNSIALAIEFGEFSYLMTGDAEDDAEQRMIEEWASELEADAYHVGHHGSSTSSTAPFMDAVDPEIAIISSALESQYDHPSEEVLLRFAELGIETYWTAAHGDIVLTTDGNEISVETSTGFSTDPLDLLEEKPDEETAAAIAPTAVDTSPGLVAG